MLPLAHTGIAAFFAENTRPQLLQPAATAFFALLPDLVDKPLFLLGVTPSSRFIAHTLFFAFAVSLIVFFAAPRKLRWPLACSALFGCTTHLLLDSYGFLPLFYPFLPYDFPSTNFDLTFNVLTTLFELIGFCCIVLVVLEKQGEKTT
ncbi:MAG: metal-dependent hydrolase [Candidatus Micrarchaeia archaeon]|jgi:membrane-bound metal-dependent hydrolase YbcI (DUF457 family)